MKPTVKVALIGSRTITERDYVFSVFNFFLRNLMKDNEVVIISGNALGVDRLAEDFAATNNLRTEIYLPNYKEFGIKATHIRNSEIVNNCDYLLAITNGSKGTESTIKKAIKRGVNVKVVKYENT